MSRSSKRRPDARAIRPTGTYSVDELADALDKSRATVQQWIRDGLPTIDAKKPALVYGWAFRNWHEARWEARRTNCAEDEFFCMGCRDRRRAAVGSLASEKTDRGCARVRACCAVCGMRMYKNLAIETAFDLLSGTQQLNEEQRFNRSCTPTDNAAKSAGAGREGGRRTKQPVPQAGRLPRSGRRSTCPSSPRTRRTSA